MSAPLPPGRTSPDPESGDSKDRPAPAGAADTLTAAELGKSPWSPPFEAGELVAGRYRVVRYLAAGAMGLVYEARDEELGGSVALKALRPEIATQSDAVERFRREIQLARRVTHANVCRIYDVGRHRARDGRDVLFLSMELLCGLTLAERIADGPLSTAELSPVLHQIAAALDAAHRAGVVHRDLKCGNIFLEPAEDGVRAVVTDFGLSRSLLASASGSGAQLSNAGLVVGTPAYLAPEQLRGDAVGPAADLYSLGVVLYEALTGAFPFTGDTPLAIAMKRLDSAPTPPSHHLPDLEPAWERLILQCLEREPEKRYGSVRQLVDELQAIEGSGAGRGPRRWVAAAMILTVLAIGGALLLPRHLPTPDSNHSEQSPAKPLARRSVAVLSFRNLGQSEERRWLSTALAEMLRSELAATEELRLVSGETVARAQLDLPLPDADTLETVTLQRLGRLLGADLILLGSYLVSGEPPLGSLRVDLRIQQVVSGEILFAEAVAAPDEELFSLVATIGEHARAALELTVPSLEVRRTTAASRPATAAAARQYALGLDHLRHYDALAARPLLEQAVAADPQHSLSRAALAECWKALGDDQKAADGAAQAYTLSGSLSRSGQLHVEGIWREITGDWPRAAEVWSALWSFFPDDPEHGLRLVHALAEAADGGRALEVITELRRLEKAATPESRVDLAEGEAALAIGDYRRSYEAAMRGVTRAEAEGARLLAAEGRLLGALSAQRLGRHAEERAALDAAETAFAEVGNRRGVARCRQRRASLFARLGEVDAAATAYDSALETFRTLGDRRGAALVVAAQGTFQLDRGNIQGALSLHRSALDELRELGDRLQTIAQLSNLGIDYSMSGNLVGAQQMFEESLALAREAGHRGRQAAALNNLAIVAADYGDFPAAERRYHEALAIFEEIGDLDAAGSAHTNLGVLQWDRGELGDARQSYDRALEIYRRLDDRSSVALELANLAEVLIDQGDTEGARKLLRQAIDTQTELDEKVAAAKNRALLARLAAEQPLPESTELDQSIEAARIAVAALTDGSFPDEAALAYGALAELLLVRGDFPSAAGPLAAAGELAAERDNPAVTLYLELLVARLDAARGHRTTARQHCVAVIAQAEATGLTRFVLSGRLQLAALEEDSDRRRALLVELEREASEHGYLRFARRARAFLPGS